MGGYSKILYADPSFLEGVARILDFGDTLTEFNRSPSPEQADLAALRADWKAIGDDLYRAIEDFEAELPLQKDVD